MKWVKLAPLRSRFAAGFRSGFNWARQHLLIFVGLSLSILLVLFIGLHAIISTRHKKTVVSNPQDIYYPKSMGLEVVEHVDAKATIARLEKLPKPTKKEDAAQLDFAIANYYVEAKDYTKAIRYYQQAVAAINDNPDYWLALARTQALANMKADAKTSYATIISLLTKLPDTQAALKTVQKEEAEL